MNKENEELCLKNVIEYCKSQSGFIKYVGYRLDGVEIPRKDRECPDFARYVLDKQGKRENTIIGIEHF